MKTCHRFGGLATALFTAYIMTIVSSVEPIPSLSAGPAATRDEEVTPIFLREKPECDFECHSAATVYFCASNGRDLDSECKVRKAQCYDPTLEVTPGRCKDTNRCRLERNHNLRLQGQPTGISVHVPVCEPDGSYSREQCHGFVGYCWCVTPSGRIIRNSTVKIGTMPPCSKTRSKKRSKCKGEAEKVNFALKLRSAIVTEYKRKAPSSSERRLQMERNAVTWKHTKMDNSNDGNLNNREMGRLLRNYKKLSKTCTRIFMKYCDTNNNRKVSTSEWKSCLGITLGLPLRPSTSVRKTVPTGPTDPRDLLKEDNDERSNNLTAFVPPSGDPNEEPGTQPQVRQSCRDTRQEVQRQYKRNVLVPQCEGPNMEFWAPVQCHEITGYCYCVLKENGHPIRRTSVSNGKPNCNNLGTTISVPIPGCPQKIKVKFLREVQSVLIDEMLQALGSRGELTSSDPNQTTKERAANWYFDVADANNDEVLSRREAKKFKKLISGRKVPKRCLRKFTKHCDRDRDNKITKDEFIACLEVRQQERFPRRPEISRSIKQLKTTDDPDNF